MCEREIVCVCERERECVRVCEGVSVCIRGVGATSAPKQLYEMTLFLSANLFSMIIDIDHACVWVIYAATVIQCFCTFQCEYGQIMQELIEVFLRTSISR